MPSTTVHIPDDLLSRINEIVKEKGISRNRFIVQACKQALDQSAGQWPEDFFESVLNSRNLKLLREGVTEVEAAIRKMRKNRQGIEL